MPHPVTPLDARHPPPTRSASMTPANDNGRGRRVTVQLALPTSITTAEVEVFSLLLAEMEPLVAANDNCPGTA